jgi:hypothetical protein
MLCTPFWTMERFQSKQKKFDQMPSKVGVISCQYEYKWKSFVVSVSKGNSSAVISVDSRTNFNESPFSNFEVELCQQTDWPHNRHYLPIIHLFYALSAKNS